MKHFCISHIAIPLATLYLRFVSLTSQIASINEEPVDIMQRQNQGRIFVFWHNQQILLPLLRNDDDVHCLISNSKDGGYLDAFAKKFGKSSIRGSSSRKGADALRKMARLLRIGGSVGIATDGPKGPAFEVKPGVVQLAAITKLPIIPIHVTSSRKKIVSSWDKTIIPLPFGQITAVYGDPITINKDHSAEESCQRIKNAIDQAQEIAESK